MAGVEGGARRERMGVGGEKGAVEEEVESLVRQGGVVLHHVGEELLVDIDAQEGGRGGCWVVKMLE